MQSLTLFTTLQLINKPILSPNKSKLSYIKATHIYNYSKYLTRMISLYYPHQITTGTSKNGRFETQIDPKYPLNYKSNMIRRLAKLAMSVGGRIAITGLAGITLGMLYFARPNKSIAQSVVENSGYSLVNENNQIRSIKDFLDSCPKNDPAYEQIKKDFIIRRDGNVVNLDNIKCIEPVSAMQLSDYSDELINLQALRTIYYMDFGMGGHLPWTEGTLYDWLKSKVGGVNITWGVENPMCCDTYDGKKFIDLPYITDYVKMMIYRDFRGIASRISVLGHEARHVDGFDHVMCNGYLNDQTFDVNNLSTFGIQWWLWDLWLTKINVGVNCLEQGKAQDILQWELTGAESASERFCDNKPPILTMPANAGGPCVGSKISGTLKDAFGNSLRGVFVDLVDANNQNYVFSTFLTDSQGTFAHVRLFGDDYKLFFDPDKDECFLPGWYDKQNSFASANILGILDNQDLEGIITQLSERNIQGPTTTGSGGKKGATLHYTAQRKDQNYTNPIKYFFEFSDGTNSGWLPTGQNSVAKAWNTTGQQSVQAKYRCAEHGIESQISEPLQVNITNPDGPDLKAQWIAEPYQTCTKPKKGLPKCTVTGGILQVVNTGNQKSGTASVAFYLSTDNAFDTGDLYLKRSSVAALKPAKTKNISFRQSLATGATAKDQYIIAVINLPTDIDTTNNVIVYGPIE
jgi:hypothetical protein